MPSSRSNVEELDGRGDLHNPLVNNARPPISDPLEVRRARTILFYAAANLE